MKYLAPIVMAGALVGCESQSVKKPAATVTKVAKKSAEKTEPPKPPVERPPVALTPPVVPAIAEMDPNNMRKGEFGTLPRSTANYRYEVVATADEDLLIFAIEGQDAEQDIVGRFWLKDRELIEAKTKVRADVFLPHVYEVIGTKANAGKSIPRIQRKP